MLDHGEGALGLFWLALRELVEVGCLGGNEEHGRCIFTSSYTGAAANTSSCVECFVSKLLIDWHGVRVWCRASTDVDEAAGRHDAVKCRAVRDKVFDNWECLGAEWLDPDGFAVLELAHVKLAGGDALLFGVWHAVDGERAHATDAFTTVVVKVDWVATIIDDALAEFGTVDILINNAGILRDKSFKKMDLEDWDIVMDVHLNGTAYVTHAAWPIMYDKGYGRIVMTSSTSGIYGNFGQANYGAAKMGMLGFINVLAIEGATKNVRVNGLAPGAATRLIATIPGRQDLDPDNPAPEAHPQLVTPAVLLMASENAPTGKVIQASGGNFSVCAVYNNQNIDLGLDVTYEDLETNAERLFDMSTAREGWNIR